MTKLLAWSAAMLLVGGAHPAVASGNAAPGRPASIDAVDYEDDRRRVLWFDPELKKLQAQLYRALPGTVNFTTGWSQDDKRALVWSYSGADRAATTC